MFKYYLQIFFLLLLIPNCQSQSQVGEAATAIELDEIFNQRKKHSFNANFAGKVTVIDFWATWCMPCIAGLASLDSLAALYEDKPVQFIAISNEKASKAKDFVKAKSLQMPFGIDTYRSVFDSFEVKGIPQTFIINRKGIIVFRGRKVTEDILAEVVATDSYQPIQTVEAAPVEISIVSKFNAGEDVLYNAVNGMLNGKESTTLKPIQQFIIRPSLCKSLNASGQRQYNNGFTGITWYGIDLPYVYESTYNQQVPSSVWIDNASKITDRFDIIYFKRNNSVEAAKSEIIKVLETSLEIHFDSIKGMQMVFELTKENNSEYLIESANLSEGTKNAYVSLAKLVGILEYHKEHIHILSKSASGLMIKNSRYELRQFFQLEPDEIETYLKEIGIDISFVSRDITTYQIIKD
ncbi:MAG: thiol-disulfide isomerase/thioredoxin [Parvicellaceae bacterium]|jgi:thiol-disulfide isomerase/thioredoxin